MSKFTDHNLSQNPSHEDLFWEYYSQFRKPLYTYLLELTGDSNLAGDLTQNVFLKFWTLTDNYPMMDKAKAFLKRKATNAFHETTRNDKSRVTYIQGASCCCDLSKPLTEMIFAERVLERTCLTKEGSFLSFPTSMAGTVKRSPEFQEYHHLPSRLPCKKHFGRCAKNAAFLINFQLKKRNKMRKSILSLLAWSLPFLLIAQSNTSTQSIVTKQETGAAEGIHWTSGLSWEQVKQKAKAENKYIFIDAYTTWCGPCKMMDKNVYSNDTVGNFFNQHFIALKLQMDKTEKDEQSIKDWYKDAARFHEEFGINSYPTLVFLSPQADILQKEVGYKPAQKIISIAKEALIPTKIYDNPFKEYRTLVDGYKQGIKHYDRMPFMINKAFELNDDDLGREMFKDYLNHASTLNENERYTKENIELWSSFVLKLDSKALQFFLKDYQKIDQIMGEKGYSTNVVNATIQGRIVDSFFRRQKGETTITGRKYLNSEVMFVQLPVRVDGKIGPDYVEADWKTLQKMIREHFSEDYAIRNVLTAKIRWYWQHQNMTNLSKTYFSQLTIYPPADLIKESDMTNQICWQTFLYVNDKKLLTKALSWSGKIMQQRANEVNMVDTYANLLYKLGRTKEAIDWEEKAIKLSPNDKTFSNTLEQIKKGEPTYLDRGAIWLNSKKGVATKYVNNNTQ